MSPKRDTMLCLIEQNISYNEIKLREYKGGLR